MGKNIFLDTESIRFLDHFREKWGRGSPLSYSKTFKRLIKPYTEEDLDRSTIVSTFEQLKSELPSSYSQLLEYSKALILKAQLTEKQVKAAEAISKLLNFKELWEENNG